MQKCKAFITGLAGTALSKEERDFISQHSPWGFILFSRNIGTADQLRALTDDLRAITRRPNLPIFVDQEGGRVQRLRPPLAPKYPAAAKVGAVFERNSVAGLRAAWVRVRLFALDMQKYGLTAYSIPLLDVPITGSDPVIGDRAYSRVPDYVIALGQETVKALRAGGILGLMKHIPGHGRAFVDTHQKPARVNADKETLRKSDFVPFKALSHKLPVAMTAHIIYEAYDTENPATLSKTVIEEVIRGEIGFDGLLMTDDICMQALPGTIAERARAAFAAGCDIVLHCDGNMTEMQAVAAESPYLAGKFLERAQLAEAWITKPEEADEQALRAEFAELMSPAATV